MTTIKLHDGSEIQLQPGDSVEVTGHPDGGIQLVADSGNPLAVSQQRYLGDGVYVSFDGYHMVLITTDGIAATNRICLNPEVFVSLIAYGQTLQNWANTPE